MASLTPRSREHWRCWLAERHDKEKEVWLVFLKKHTPKPNLSYNDAVEEALCFGWIDGVKRSIDADRYMHRFSPRKCDSQWSASNIERVQRMSAAGMMAPAGERAVVQARKNGRWEQSDKAAGRFSMPAELEDQLRLNPQAAAFFASLAPSYQQQYMAWIATAKREDTRRRRLSEAMALLGRGKKLGMR
jgi:uncharacterized protein YdeI (YjbR/CyaY-like superfamily)